MQDDSAIKQGVSELEGYLRTNQITIGLLAYISKVLLALSRARDYVFQEDALNALEEIYQSLGPILEICGVVAAVIAVFPAAAPLVAIFLEGFNLYFTDVFGFKGIKGFFDFFGEIGEAQTEADIDQAARDLADGMENIVGFAIGVAGLFKSLKTLATEGQKLFKAGQELVELFKTGITKLPAFGKVLLKFGANGTFLASVAEAVLNVGKGGIQQLWEVIVQLGQNDKVFNLLAELADAKENRLLDDVLKIGTKAIDDLAAILDTGATAEQIVKLRFEVEGMSIEKLKDLLTKWEGMTPEVLINLFFDSSGVPREGMSITLLEEMLSFTGMTASLLLKFLEKQDMTPALLRYILTNKGMKVATLEELLINADMPVSQLKEYIAKLGVPQTEALLQKYGGDAMKYYGADWFKAYKGIDADTTVHATVGHGTGNGTVKGCHDTDNFENQFVNSIPPKVNVHTRTQSGIYTKYSYNLVTSTGTSPKTKTTRQNLAKDWPKISKDITNELDDMIRAKTFPVGQTTLPIDIQYEGVTWEFRFGSSQYSSGNHIRTIYPTI